ncbi:MAG TPA: patatin-like phospholipase family protein [Anaerolineae bacterium]|nr:patatin-like phospholipase family protein [Anaerolineae bacterium]
MQEEKPKRALVLSGGGGRGAYECGVYKYLEEAGLKPDILVGTSIGAINAAAIASGKSSADLEQAWLATRTRDIQRFWRLRPWRAVYDTSPWYRTLHRFIDFDGLARTDKRLLITATEVETGNLRIFDNREVTLTPSHIMASCSIPLVYPWTEIENHHYWDGAVMANTPLAGAIDAGADEILVVLLSPVGERHIPPPRWPWEAFAVMLDLALSATFENDVKQLENVNRLVVAQLDEKHRSIHCQVIVPSRETGLLRIIRYEPEASRELIEMGYADAKRVLGRRFQRPGA